MLSVLSIGMSSPLRNFVGVTDMDGFMINGRFYCKEPRALRVGDAAARLFLFDIGVRWDDLTPKDRRTCRYVTKFIHKLPLGVPRSVEAFEIIRSNVKKSNVRSNVKKSNVRSNVKNLTLDLTLDPTLHLMLFVLSIGMSSPLSNFVGVIDMDGFMINGRFYCKEPRALRVGDAAARSFLFDIGVRWGDLTPKDRRTCRYVTQFIHKLPFGVPRSVEAFENSALGRITVEFYQRAWQNGSSVIGYKGGHYEKDLLASLVCHP